MSHIRFISLQLPATSPLFHATVSAEGGRTGNTEGDTDPSAHHARHASPLWQVRWCFCTEARGPLNPKVTMVPTHQSKYRETKKEQQSSHAIFFCLSCVSFLKKGIKRNNQNQKINYTNQLNENTYLLYFSDPFHIQTDNFFHTTHVTCAPVLIMGTN